MKYHEIKEHFNNLSNLELCDLFDASNDIYSNSIFKHKVQELFGISELYVYQAQSVRNILVEVICNKFRNLIIK